MLKRKQIQRLRDTVTGDVFMDDDEAFRDHCRIQNQLVAERQPQLVVRPYDADDVAAAVRFAGEVHLDIGVKGGGYHPGGFASAEDGLLLDMSSLKSIQVNPTDAWAITQTGVTWREFDQVTHAFGLAATGATAPGAGIAGQTLTGGLGWLHRKQGLTCDHIISAELVTADGAFVNVSEEENPDLLWALKGAGTGFGVVTSIAYQLQPVGPEIVAGYITYPMSSLGDLAKHHQGYADELPSDLSTWLFLRPSATGPDCVLGFCHVGDLEEGQTWHKTLTSFANPKDDTVGITDYLSWQKTSPLVRDIGSRQLWRSLDLPKFTPAVLDLFTSSVEQAPVIGCQICVSHMGGEVAGALSELSALNNRQSENRLFLIASWEDSSEDSVCSAWVESLYAGLVEQGGVEADPGFLTERESTNADIFDAATVQRLIELKNTFDPENVFRPIPGIPRT